jgi:hypothetical protein
LLPFDVKTTTISTRNRNEREKKSMKEGEKEEEWKTDGDKKQHHLFVSLKMDQILRGEKRKAGEIKNERKMEKQSLLPTYDPIRGIVFSAGRMPISDRGTKGGGEKEEWAEGEEDEGESEDDDEEEKDEPAVNTSGRQPVIVTKEEEKETPDYNYLLD